MKSYVVVLTNDGWFEGSVVKRTDDLIVVRFNDGSVAEIPRDNWNYVHPIDVPTGNSGKLDASFVEALLSTESSLVIPKNYRQCVFEILPAEADDYISADGKVQYVYRIQPGFKSVFFEHLKKNDFHPIEVINSDYITYNVLHCGKICAIFKLRKGDDFLILADM